MRSSSSSFPLVPSLPVLVLNYADNYWQHGPLGIARSLGRLGVAVHTMQIDTRAPAARSRYFQRRWPVDFTSIEPAEAVERLVAAGGDLERAILVTPDDAGTMLVAEHRDDLRPYFLWPDQSLELVKSLSNKRSQYELCIEHGVPAPTTEFPATLEEAVHSAEALGYPCVVKGIDAGVAHRHGRLATVSIVTSPDELVAAFEALQTPETANVLVQEHIPGEPRDVWMFNGYFDAESRCLFDATGRKLRQHPPYTGMTTLGSCEPNEVVRSMTIDLMERIGYRGVLDLGFRYDRRDGTYKLLDVNPRIGGTFRLFVGARGLDCARALYLDLTGQSVPADAPSTGRRWLVDNFDVKSSIAYMKDGRLTARQWAASLRGVEERAWFARDDIAPFLKMCRKFFLQLPRSSTTVHDARGGEPQRAVSEFFETKGAFWADVYDEANHEAVVYRRRRDRVLAWADSIGGNHPGTALDAGCGAGITAVPLACRGWDVVAIDPAESMITETRRAASNAGVADRLVAEVGDAHELRFPDESFDLIVAVGVLPWLHSPGRALDELWRVLRPGGRLLITSDNRARLTKLVHPMYTPILAGPRRWAKRALIRAGILHEDPAAVWPRMYYPAQARTLLRAAGFATDRERTLGFPPPAALGRVLSAPRARRFDARLQSLADARAPGVKSLGMHHVILARKEEAQPRAVSSS
jgi:D-aspartate ligase